MAAWLGTTASDPGTGRLVFAVGGTEGHHPRLIQQARLRLALSRLTFPHDLARVVLAEQVYRALATLNNHPYHRG
ncbi:MAG: 23S rRNA (pseudouridine(1915)-N(3))-methyltransferase RlmH [bacterium]